eukprot:356940-Chlamydomonas_euryale.AAC.1
MGCARRAGHDVCERSKKPEKSVGSAARARDVWGAARTWLHCIFAKVVLAPPLELSGSPSEAKGFGLGDNAGLPLVPRGLRDAGLSAAALPASHAGCGGTGGRSALSVRPLADVLVSWKPPPRCSAPIWEGKRRRCGRVRGRTGEGGQESADM